MKATSRSSSIEILEARIAPATLNVGAGGDVTYTAGAGGIFNFLILTIENVGGINKYRFDDSENITVTGFGTATGSGTSIVDINLTGLTSLTFNLGDQNDTLVVRNLQHPLTVNDGAGDDTVRLETNTLTPSGSISVAAETVNINSAVNFSGTASATIRADNMAIGAAIQASDGVTLQPLTAGREIDLGTETAGKLSLVASEIGFCAASAVDLQIGSDTGGAITISAAISGAANSLLLKSGTGISETGTGAISGNNLAITSGGNVTLNGANNVNALAVSMPTGAAAFSFRDATGFVIGTFVGVSGLTVGSGGAGSITFTLSGNIQGGPVVTGTLALDRTGSVTLNGLGNEVDTLVARGGGTLTYLDETGFSVGSFGGIDGISYQNLDSVVTR